VALMDRTPVSSSAIKSVGHDPNTNELEIEFHSGRIHSYANVSIDEHRALMDAPSLGKHFGKHLRGRHHVRVDGTQNDPRA